MFELIDKQDPTLQHSKSLVVTYPRTVNILYGNYPIIEDTLNLIQDIKNDINEEQSYLTNVKGGKTSWTAYNDHPFTKKFIRFLTIKHQSTHPDIFKNFYSSYIVRDSWGNEVKKDDYIKFHNHEVLHCILYLTDGEPLILPELNLKIHPQPGDYYFFPPYILHGTNRSTSDKNRYTFVMNLVKVKEWDKPDFKK